MHSADDLLRGIRDDDWMVRFEVVDRLIARAGNDERTLPALVDAAQDSAAAVRECVVLRLGHYSDERATSAIRRALTDDDPEVRGAAEIALRQVDG